MNRANLNRVILNSKWGLPICFLVLPALSSVLIVWLADEVLKIVYIENFILVSGYLFTASSLFLVFILYKKFNVSEYKKTEVNRNFFENYAFDDLHSALENIRASLTEEDTFINLNYSCTVIRNVHKSLTSYEQETDLKAYSNEIKSIFTLINKYGLSNIHNLDEAKTIRSIPDANRRHFISKIDDFLWELNNKKRSGSDEK